jgi:polygalacturonase
MMLPFPTRALPLVPLALLCLANAGHAQTAPTASTICDPHVFGATNDGKTDNTVMLQKTIDGCAEIGGGIVRLSGGGTYVTGPISLRSHVHLMIDAGTTLKNTNDHSRYQPAFIGYPFQFKNDPTENGGIGPALPGLPEAMISAKDAIDVGILGRGTIDGSGADPAAFATPDNLNGYSWWKLAADSNAAKAGDASYRYPGYPDIPTSNGLPRPWMIEFYNARQVTVRGVTVTNCSMWCLGLRYTNGARVSNYVVRNPSDSPNTDGIDLAGSQDVTLANLDIATGDDNVAIKSGLPGVPAGAYYAPPYSLPQIATSNVTVANSRFGTGHGLSVGSETVNGVNGIRVNNVLFAGTDNGFRIKTGRDRGNQIYGMAVSNLTMVDVPTPLSLSEYYPTVPTATQGDIEQAITREPHVHDISISNVTVTNPRTVRDTAVGGGLVLGLPESPIYNLLLSRIHISSSNPSSMRLRNLKDSWCNDVVIASTAGAAIAPFSTDAAGGLTNVTGCSTAP